MKQHLIDPEICIRCYTCEMNCPIGAIRHDDNNVVVDAAACNMCMNCIPVCPTGSIDSWREVDKPYSLSDQFGWSELPAATVKDTASEPAEALDAAVNTLLKDAHQGAGGKMWPPPSASRPVVNLYTTARPATARVQGTYALTARHGGEEVRHVILDFGALPFPVLEGQSIGIIPPAKNGAGKPELPRLYSISSPRDGERANFNNLSLTVKRSPDGYCSNYVCDLKQGDEVTVVGPFGATFLMPDDPAARLLMICTGTGAAPFRAFTMRRTRTGGTGDMMLFFGARTPENLPYFGPLNKIPDEVLRKHLVFSRMNGHPKEYVQDRMRKEGKTIAAMLADPRAHVYVCGLRAMEEGVEQAFIEIAALAGQDWPSLRDEMRGQGRYHVETY